MKEGLACPACGQRVEKYYNPVPTVDVIVYNPDFGLVLVERANEPLGWALPGGFVDLGESVESAALREIREETGLEVVLTGLLGVYSRPDRDPRRHTLSVVFTGRALDPLALKAGDDARQAAFYQIKALPVQLAFDHNEILADFMQVLRGQRTLAPVWQAVAEYSPGTDKLD